ncbi:hypothetical protein [Mucilaginibacter sp.]|uniref:hypothetical protein n=1 Tax=Mucilaginibacter sp. TaxID=1882438 RepID=UPI003D0FB3C7
MEELVNAAPKIVIIDQLLALRKYILFFAVLFAAIGAKAQAGYNYYEMGVGTDVSYVRGFTNIPRQDNHLAVALNFIYNYNPYLPIEAEIQKGTLSGGDTTVAVDRYGRKFKNNYLAFALHADVQLGAAIDYEGSWFLSAVKNFYVGTGVGFISNSNKVQRTNLILANGPLTYVFPGKDNSINLMIPIRVGYEFRIFDYYNEPSFAIDIGYIHNIVFGEGLDGYNDPTNKFKNNAVDQYRQFVVGFKYYFGNTVSYNKLVRDFR